MAAKRTHRCHCKGGYYQAFVEGQLEAPKGLIAGWATGKIMKGSGYGPLMDIALGIVGGIVGGWIMRILGFYTSGGLIPSILVAILGAVVLVSLVRMIKKA